MDNHDHPETERDIQHLRRRVKTLEDEMDAEQERSANLQNRIAELERTVAQLRGHTGMLDQ